MSARPTLSPSSGGEFGLKDKSILEQSDDSIPIRLFKKGSSLRSSLLAHTVLPHN